jgi:hypothetical protein
LLAKSALAKDGAPSAFFLTYNLPERKSGPPAQSIRWIRFRVQFAAEALLAGDFQRARQLLGRALHTAQDENHAYTPFKDHQGKVRDLFNATGRDLATYDMMPTAAERMKARNRTVEVVEQFYRTVQAVGAQAGLSEGAIGELLYQFQNLPGPPQPRP